MHVPDKCSTPLKITEDILAFCKAIGAGTQPFFMEIAPQDGCEPLNCHPNIKKIVNEYGGTGQTGWSIWQFGDLWLESEFHEVWVKPNGTPIDITPDTHGYTRRLFLPDSRFKFEGYCIPKQIMVLQDTSDNFVQHIAKQKLKAIAIMCRYKAGESIVGADAEKILRLQTEAQTNLCILANMPESIDDDLSDFDD